MQIKQKRRIIICFVIALLILLVFSSYPKWNSYFGNEIACRYYEIDCVNALTRIRKYSFYIEVSSSRKQNWLSDFIAENGLKRDGEDWELIGLTLLDGNHLSGGTGGELKALIDEAGEYTLKVRDYSVNEEHSFKSQFLEAFRRKDPKEIRRIMDSFEKGEQLY